MALNGIDFRLNAPVDGASLRTLFAAAWGDDEHADYAERVLPRSLAYVCAYEAARLAGFVNLAWDGGVHAFLLDATVHPQYQRRGIGREMVRRAEAAARDAGCVWLHVDYEPALARFYEACGFKPAQAGLIRLDGLV